MAEARSLKDFPVHLGLGASAQAEPQFTGMAWYADYAARHAADGAEGRLVSISDFTQDWASWEMHPEGDELVVCLSGVMTLIQELADGAQARVQLREGEYAINPRGLWHTAEIAERASALFITAGLGTQHRAR